jgi:hypothetical protein
MYVDDNVLSNQLLAPLEVGHVVDTMAKVHSYVISEPVNVVKEKVKPLRRYYFTFVISYGFLGTYFSF